MMAEDSFPLSIYLLGSKVYPSNYEVGVKPKKEEKMKLKKWIGLAAVITLAVVALSLPSPRRNPSRLR